MPTPSANEANTDAPSARWKAFFLRWIQQATGVLVAGWLVTGIRYQEFQDLLLAAFFLSTLHTFVRPFLMLISLPLLVLTLGLFTVVINAGLLWLVSRAMQPRFEVQSFAAACWGAVVIGVVALFLKACLGFRKSRFKITLSGRNRPGTPAPKRPADPGDGPVIDV